MKKLLAVIIVAAIAAVVTTSVNAEVIKKANAEEIMKFELDHKDELDPDTHVTDIYYEDDGSYYVSTSTTIHK